MNLNEKLIEKYAKRIFGFAYTKTRDYREAEDLSQEILAELCNLSIAGRDIENMDAYIYRICFYTWSKYLRRNKPYWEAMNNVSALELLCADGNPETDYVREELCEKLRQEIVYLSKTRRDIIVMRYYDGKSGEEIAKALNIPHSTVRYHLRKTKNDLKERIEMQETSGIYKPVRMKVGHSGWAKNGDMSGLNSDALVQNICFICYGRARSVEEMARILGVAAIYLEDKIEKLIFMDYLKEVGRKKYQTNFFIYDEKFDCEIYRYVYDNIMPLAEQFYNVVNEAVREITELGFTGANIGKDELIWDILPLFMLEKTGEIMQRIHKERHLEHTRPIRKDGTEHWVEAHIVGKRECEDKAFKEYLENFGTWGLKTRRTDTVSLIQFDLKLLGCGWRVFDNAELDKLKRIRALSISSTEPNEYDKSIIAELAEAGYIKVKNGKISFLIPYLTSSEIKMLREIIDKKSAEYFDTGIADGFFNSYIDKAMSLIPDFVDDNEKKHIATNTCDAMTSSMYMLYKNGLLSEFDKEQSKRLCTIVWER